MRRSRIADLTIFLLVAIAVGVYFLWEVRSAGYPFNWSTDQPGYYNYLARGFAGGHLYLPIDPSPQLLAQPNPWDPHVDDSLKLFDAVLYQKRYYLYHGAGPAVMFFAPWQLLTGRDLPENFALFLFCCGGFTFSCLALLEMIRQANARVSPPVLAAMLMALGICQGAPFLLSRVWVYEIAVGAGYFCLLAAVFFVVRSLRLPGTGWLISAGLLFGLAVACRPHLAIAGAAAVAMAAVTSRRRALTMAVPFVLVIAAIAIYNYERFGSPLEFGNTWQLAGENQGRLKMSTANAAPGLYYLLLARPALSPVFPWVELAWPLRDFPRPQEYYAEQTVGGLFLAPFLLGIPAIFAARRNRILLLTLLASGSGILLFVTLTGWSAQRYEVDFLPVLALAVFGSLAEVMTRLGRPWASMLSVLLVITIALGCVVNLALGISGPYWEMIRNKPARFVKIASWFSPMERHRPVLNPPIDVTFHAVVKPGPDHLRMDLLKAARFPNQYELWVEHVAGTPRLISSYAGSTVSQDIVENDLPAEFRVRYLPQSGEIRISRGGTEVLSHKIGALVAAPSQIVIIAL